MNDWKFSSKISFTENRKITRNMTWHERNVQAFYFSVPNLSLFQKTFILASTNCLPKKKCIHNNILRELSIEPTNIIWINFSKHKIPKMSIRCIHVCLRKWRKLFTLTCLWQREKPEKIRQCDMSTNNLHSRVTSIRVNGLGWENKFNFYFVCCGKRKKIMQIRFYKSPSFNRKSSWNHVRWINQCLLIFIC